MDKFGTEDPVPPTCLISVYGSPAPNTVPTLHYAIPLEGVVRPVTLFIHRALRNAPPPSSGKGNQYTLTVT